MKPELIEHATRLLQQASTRCMDAVMLHGLVQRDLGIELPFRRFMDTVRERPDRFAVLSCPFAVHEQRGWDGREQAAYAAALARAGLSSSTITLAERPADPMLVPQESTAQTRPDLLTELHTALADLLLAAADEPVLRDAVGGAMAELVAVRNRLDQGERRSSTLHHSASSSSPATTKPAAAAADRMPAASSTRMPDRIAQP